MGSDMAQSLSHEAHQVLRGQVTPRRGNDMANQMSNN